MTWKDKYDMWTLAVQALLLSAAFALTFSWDADIEPKLLMLIILILLVLQYPMLDRLKDWLEQRMKELHKIHGVSQIMLINILDLLPGKAGYDHLPESERLSKAKELTEQFENLQLEYEKSFEEGFERERDGELDFLVDTVGVVVYFGVLVGSSALIGWLVSLLL